MTSVTEPSAKNPPVKDPVKLKSMVPSSKKVVIGCACDSTGKPHPSIATRASNNPTKPLPFLIFVPPCVIGPNPPKQPICTVLHVKAMIKKGNVLSPSLFPDTQN